MLLYFRQSKVPTHFVAAFPSVVPVLLQDRGKEMLEYFVNIAILFLEGDSSSRPFSYVAYTLNILTKRALPLSDFSCLPVENSHQFFGFASSSKEY